MRSTRQGGSPLSSSPCPLYRELLECRTRYTHVELANSSDRVPGTHGNVGQSSSMEDVNCNLELTETFLRLQMKPRNASTVKDWTTTTKTTGNVLTIHWTIILTKEDSQVFLGDHLKMEAICHPLAPPALKQHTLPFIMLKNHSSLGCQEINVTRQEKLSEASKELQKGG